MRSNEGISKGHFIMDIHLTHSKFTRLVHTDFPDLIGLFGWPASLLDKSMRNQTSRCGVSEFPAKWFTFRRSVRRASFVYVDMHHFFVIIVRVPSRNSKEKASGPTYFYLLSMVNSLKKFDSWLSSVY